MMCIIHKYINYMCNTFIYFLYIKLRAEFLFSCKLSFSSFH